MFLHKATARHRCDRVSVCAVHLSPFSLPPCDLTGGSTLQLGREFGPGHAPLAMLGQGEDSAGVTAPWVAWLNHFCSCCFSSPRQNEDFSCGSKFFRLLAGSTGRRHWEAALGQSPAGGGGCGVGMLPAPTMAALSVGSPHPATKGTGSSASPTAAGAGTCAWIKESKHYGSHI